MIFLLSTYLKHYFQNSKYKAIILNYYHLDFFSVDKSTNLLCKRCSTVDEPVQATHFCKTCDNPDPWCVKCAKRHLKQKFSKSHEMCADIEQFPNKEQEEWYLVILINIKFVYGQLL